MAAYFNGRAPACMVIRVKVKQSPSVSGPALSKELKTQPTNAVVEPKVQTPPKEAEEQAPLDALEEEDAPALVTLDDAEVSPGEMWMQASPPMPEMNTDKQNGNPVVVAWDGAKTKAGEPVSVSANRLGMAFNLDVDGLDGGKNNLNVGHRNWQVTTTHELAGDGHKPTMNGFVGAWDGEFAAGGGGQVSSLDGKTTGAWSSYLNLDREVTHSGRYTGDLESLKGKHGVEVKRTHGGTTMFTLTHLAALIGIGGGITPSGKRELTYKTFLDPEDAKKVVLEKKGVIGFVRDTARAAGLKKEPIAIPSLDKPETLKLGDELTVHTTGSISAGLAFGAFGLAAGAQVVMKGEFELAAKKTGEQTVELTITPSNVKAVQTFVGLPLLTDIGGQLAKAVALKQSFVFDLATPTGKAAYEKALKGELPGAVAVKSKTTGAELAGLVRDEKLPDGVTRRFAESSHASRRTGGGGLNFGFIQEGGVIGGLGRYWVKGQSSRELTDGKVLSRFDVRDIESRREVLLSGTEKLGVTAAKRTVTTFDDGEPTSKFAGVDLKATFSDNKVRGLELNDEVIQRLNNLFDLDIQEMQRERKNQEWTVTFTRHLSETDLANLAKVDVREYRMAALVTEIPEQVLRNFSTRMLEKTDPGERADTVLDFITEHGLAGFSALHFLMRNDATKLERETDAYDSAFAKADKLALEYCDPYKISEAVDGLASRFKKGNLVLDDLERALQDLGDDPFALDEEKTELKARIAETVKRVTDVFAVDHLSEGQRSTLYDALGRGWVSSNDEALRAHLSTAGISQS